MASITDMRSGMAYYNPLTMYRQAQQNQQPSAASSSSDAQQLAHRQSQHAAMQPQNVPDIAGHVAQQYWYGYPHRHPASLHPHHHHQSTSGPQQYLDHPGELLPWPHHTHYSHHLQQYQHQHAAYQQQAQLAGPSTDWTSEETNIHHQQQQLNLTDNDDTSPPRTVSGSEISSPRTPATPPANNNNNCNVRNNNNNNNNNNSSDEPRIKVEQISPFEWMNKPSYQSQTNPGKTRTKDKYRVVYTDHQRLELEKEFHFSRYITIRRKSELATNLALSERQVKIWFQNRRAKERKQTKKLEGSEQKDIKPTIEMEGGPGGMVGLGALGGMSSMLSGLMQSGGSPPLNLGPPPHGLAGYSASSLQPHNHQHAHPHPVMGL